MGVATIPSAVGGGIKTVQRGLAAGSGNVTITAVDLNKSFVTVFGTASSGTVALSGNVASGTATWAGSNLRFGNGGTVMRQDGSLSGNMPIDSTNISLPAQSLSGGSNNLVSAVVQGYLSNSTTLVVSGACRWEVVEFA